MISKKSVVKEVVKLLRGVAQCQFFLICFVPVILHAQSSSNIEFQHVNIQQGLSSNWVTSIIMDSKGFMWFGSNNGLDRWDGVEMKTFKNNLISPEILANNTINCVYEDSKGRIWIGTIDGINIFDWKNEQFRSFKSRKGDSTSLGGKNVTKIVEDKAKNIWIATTSGLDMYNEQLNTFVHFKNNPYDKNSLINNSINDIEIDLNQNLWIGTRNGVDHFNPLTKTFRHFYDSAMIAGDIDNLKSDANNLSMNFVNDIHIDNKGDIWVGANNGGLYTLDNRSEKFKSIDISGDDTIKGISRSVQYVIHDNEGLLYFGTDRGIYVSDDEKKKFKEFASSSSNPGNFIGDAIKSLFFDHKNQILWIGTQNGGINYFNKVNKAFKKFKIEEGGISRRTIFSFVEDNDENLWIATFGGGVNVQNQRTGQIKSYKHGAEKHSLIADEVTSVEKDKYGQIWIGTYRGGVSVYNSKLDNFKNYLPDPNDSSTIRGSNIYDIHKDFEGNLWFGTEADEGLNIFDPGASTFRAYSHIKVDPETPRNDFVRQVLDYDRENLLVITFKSIQIFNKKTHIFKRFYSALEEKANNIQCVLLGKNGKMWIGTNSGLILIDTLSKNYKILSEIDGLPSNDITAIEEDDKNGIWISTKTNGLFKLTTPIPDTGHLNIAIFSTPDGLQSREFVSRASYKGKDNSLYFGGQYGFNKFDPDKVSGNLKPPPVVITKFKIFNEDLTPRPDSKLEQSITEVKKIILSHKDYVFSIGFASLNYLSPEKNQYKYKLENFDKDWNYVKGQNNIATYTNLDPGTYTFVVMGSNNYGIWNEKGRRLTIVIKPPYWKEWWFITLAAIITIAALIGFFVQKSARIKRQRELLEAKVKTRTLELQKANNALINQQEELRAQGEKIERLYNDVTDSIRAAETIQTIILSGKSVLRKFLPQSFVLNQPKDIVSGDFYWCECIDNKIVLALADCTGHGVSGALMTVNGHYLLNQLKQDFKAPSDFLNKLNHLIFDLELKSNVEDMYAIGMDISVCVLDLQQLTLKYAAANHKIYLQRAGEIIEFKGNSFPIGQLIKGQIPTFADHDVVLEKNDIVYLFTDGYTDQFGGEEGVEKIKHFRFKTLLSSLTNVPIREQEFYIKDFLLRWKKENEQMDDILVIGFQVR